MPLTFDKAGLDNPRNLPVPYDPDQVRRVEVEESPLDLRGFRFGSDGPALKRMPEFFGPEQWCTYVRDGKDNPAEEMEIHHVQDVEGILNIAHDFRKTAIDTNGFSRSREFRHVGVIPVGWFFGRPDKYTTHKDLKNYLMEHPEFRTVNNTRFIGTTTPTRQRLITA